jgi:hypothetical protein
MNILPDLSDLLIEQTLIGETITVTLRVGDRVIQQVNDYQREVFNGDLGTCTGYFAHPFVNPVFKPIFRSELDRIGDCCESGSEDKKGGDGDKGSRGRNVLNDIPVLATCVLFPVIVAHIRIWE